MKLSELIAYRNRLGQYNAQDIKRLAEKELDKVLHEIDSVEFYKSDVSAETKHKIENIKTSFDQFDQSLSMLLEDLNKTIEETEHPYFVESYRLYNEEMCFESSEYILNRRMPMSDETKALIETRIKSHSDWKYPGMILRPGLEDFVKHMVSLDPLYLLDREHDLISPAMEKFPIEYQRRLRPYYIRENADSPILDKIPNDQFGFCLAFNFFEFKPLEILRIYLTEIYQKLRPGGILAMTFNDCDRSHCVALVESHFTCYTPGHMVRELAKVIGYEIIFNWNDYGNLTWLELKKPGELDSIRAGQTLAKIVAKSK